jgi:hypothetical protein
MINNLKQKELDKIIMHIIYDAITLGWTVKQIDNNIFEFKKKK